MSVDFIAPADKPALLAISTPEWVEPVRAIVTDLDYKVQHLLTNEEFAVRFDQVPHKLVVVEESFGGKRAAENPTLQMIQRLPMNRRRHTVFILLGGSFETLNPMAAFQQSVHAVVNFANVAMLGQIIQKAAGDNELFLHTYRETQRRMIEKRA